MNTKFDFFLMRFIVLGAYVVKSMYYIVADSHSGHDVVIDLRKSDIALENKSYVLSNSRHKVSTLNNVETEYKDANRV